MHMVCTTSALIYYQSFANVVHHMCTSSALCVTLSSVSTVGSTTSSLFVVFCFCFLLFCCFSLFFFFCLFFCFVLFSFFFFFFWGGGGSQWTDSGYSPLNMHEHSPRLFREEYSLYIRTKLTSAVNHHDSYIGFCCVY